jgi:hypothetical protein
MAPFNPNQQVDQSPGVRNIGAIDVPQNIMPKGVERNDIMPHGVEEGDKSAAYAGQAAGVGYQIEATKDSEYGELFKDTTTGLDFLGKAGVSMVKKDIEDKVYSVADRERQAYTDALEKIKKGVGVKNVLDANASDDDSVTPSDISNLPGTLSALQGARDSGKISGSYYQSRLLSEAKALRAQYPGFREEIDQQFAKVTGTNPANAYITALVQDINRASSSANSEKNKTLTYIQNNLAFPGSTRIYKEFNEGTKTAQDVIEWAAPYEQQKYDLNMRALRFQDTKNTREDRTRIAGDNIDAGAGIAVSRTVDQIMEGIGLKNTGDLDRLTGLEKTKAIDPKQWADYGQTITNAITQQRTAMIQDADRYGYTKDAGGKAEVIKRVDAALDPLYQLRDRIYNHDFGGIYSIKKSLEAQSDISQQKMLNDPKIGPVLQTAKTLKEIGGESNLQQFQLDVIKGDYAENFKSWFKASSQEMQTQFNMKTKGVPYTFNDRIDTLKSNGVNDVKLNKAIFNEVSKIADPNVPEAIRMNYALAAFSEGNRGMISKLQADGVDDHGKPIQGQNAVFQKFTSPEMTKAIYAMGQKDPTIWQNYVNWTKETIGSELMNREINDLKAIPDNAGVKVGWDVANHRFKVEDTRDRETQYYQDKMRGGSATAAGANSYFNTVQSSVNRMNSQIYNFKRVAEASGEDVDTFVLKTIADAAGPEALKNVNGIPYNILRSYGLSKVSNGGR